MPESTRVARLGQSDQEVHLKKQMEIRSEIIDDVARLPSTSTWFVLLRNTNTGRWTLHEEHDYFEDADRAFVQRTQTGGFAEAERLGVGKGDSPTAGREIGPGQ